MLFAMNESTALTPVEVGRRLSVSASFVRQMVRDGRLPKVPGLGTAVRIPSWAVDALIGQPPASHEPVDGVAPWVDPSARRR